MGRHPKPVTAAVIALAGINHHRVALFQHGKGVRQLRSTRQYASKRRLVQLRCTPARAIGRKRLQSAPVWRNACSSGVLHRQQSQECSMSKVRHAAAMTTSSSAWPQRARSLDPNAVHIGRTFFP